MQHLLKFILAIFFGMSPSLTATAGTKQFDRTMQPVLRQYLKIQKSLAADSLKGVKEAARSIIKHSATIKPSTVSGKHAGHYKNVPKNLKKSAKKLATAKNIASARESFKNLSKPMAMWASMSKPSGVDVVFCSMVRASWLQKSGVVKNPYYGKEMLSCGEVLK